jgi:molybdenum ABC transporter ATP-binding protein
VEANELLVDVAVPLRSFRLEVDVRVGRETLAVAGPSGAGKSTVLRAVAGLVRPAAGRIALDGETWFDEDRRVHLPPEERSVGLVFQDYALFPHLSVRQNVAFGARRRAARRADVEGLLDRLGIGALAEARPGELSGGERQRVALARALARDPGALLLDEPMSALDPHTREQVRAELGDLLRDLGLPTILVTHDFEDASALAERVAVIRAGRLVQEGAPDELVARPADDFVASLTGANLLVGRAAPGPEGLTEVVLADGARVLSTDRLSGRVGVVVHPTEIALARAHDDGDSSLNHLRGRVSSVARVANRVRVRVGPVTAEITGMSADRLGLAEGEWAVASFKATGTRLVPLGASDGEDT